MLWFRSLRDGTARPIAGTRGGTSPRISPDGARVAYLIGDRVMVVPVAGGEPRRLQEGQGATSLQWVSATEVLSLDLDGYRLKQLDREGGSAQAKSIPRCVLGQWAAELKQLVCSYNRTAVVFDPESGKQWTLRSARPDGSPASLLTGSAFRIVDRRYLVYLAVDGSVLAARYDPATHLAQRSVTLLTGVRREAFGEAQFDLSADGTLVYAPGMDGTIGRMVSLRSGGAPQPMPVETGDIQRYDLSRDRRWLAAAIQATDGMELRIYDLRDGQQFTWLKGEAVRHPFWSPDGKWLLVSVRDSTRFVILRGAPSSGTQPDTLARFEFDPHRRALHVGLPEREAPPVPDARRRTDRSHLFSGGRPQVAAGLRRGRTTLDLGHRGAVPQRRRVVPVPRESGDRRARRRHNLLGPGSTLLRHLRLVQSSVARRRDHLCTGAG
jgi:hypothetical protein